MRFYGGIGFFGYDKIAKRSESIQAAVIMPNKEAKRRKEMN
jgi:hypothetical protein